MRSITILFKRTSLLVTSTNSAVSCYFVDQLNSLPGPEIIKLFSCSNFHAQLCLARENLQLLVIWDLLAWQISCSAELSM